VKTQENTKELLSRLYEPVLTARQAAHLLARAVKTRIHILPWYWAFLYKCIETLALTAAGLAFGVVLVVIAHYTGIEAWLDSHPSAQ
jgi:hypothetical protein